MSMESLPSCPADASSVEDGEDDLDEYLGVQLERPEFRALYEDSQLRSNLLRCLVSARQQAHLTQQAVALLMGTTQSAVSELEGGATDPRLSTLQRYARALDRRIAAWVLPESAEASFLPGFLNFAQATAVSSWHWSSAQLVNGEPSARFVAVGSAFGYPSRVYFAGSGCPTEVLPALSSTPEIEIPVKSAEQVTGVQLSRVSA